MRPSIAALDEADLQAAQALVRECGWNQVAADWSLFLRAGQAFKVPAGEGALAATAAILPYAPRFGWISMVLVSQAHRRQGIATALLERCIAQLRERGLVPVLDATPAGREVYRQMGFRDGWAITRWRRTSAAAAAAGEAPTDVKVRPLEETDWPRLGALDLEAFGADRGTLLHGLAARSTAFACVAEQEGVLAGYLLGRDGRIATQVGPVVAASAPVAAALLGHALSRIEGQVLVDALDRHQPFASLLQAHGFAVERGYTRMTLDTDRPFGDADRTFAIAGPELG